MKKASLAPGDGASDAAVRTGGRLRSGGWRCCAALAFLGRGGSGSGRALDAVGREFQHLVAHLLAGFELHHGPGRDANVPFGSVRVSSDPCLADFDLEDAEIPEFHGLPVADGFSDDFQGPLHDFGHVLLDQSGLAADGDHDVALGH